jgi:alkanesulfonate monooxygenase SsuD/methylene tetrahydromethanopterin reductase-like flavin-dependent oxidoreductase (luciferase family)
MKIGISLTPNLNGGTDPHEAVRHLVWAARYADAHDFDIVWTTEHHFTGVAFSSSPSVILSHYAAVTERVQLGYAVAILPFHHPVRFAEDLAWIDNFSNGRLIAGASPGWAAYEFSVLGVPLEERRERFVEALTIVRKALAGGTFSHQGRFWQVPETRIMPPPLQPGGPKFVTATTSEEGLLLAAKLRLSPLLGFGPPAALAEQRQRYIDALRADGASEEELTDLLSRLGALRRVLIRASDAEAEEEAVAAVLGFAAGSAQLRVDATTGQPVEGIVRRRWDSEDRSDPRKTYAFSGTLWGSPETVVRRLLELRDVGLGHVVLQFHTTTRNADGVKENIRRFATEVLPAYRAATAAAASVR